METVVEHKALTFDFLLPCAHTSLYLRFLFKESNNFLEYSKTITKA